MEKISKLIILIAFLILFSCNNNIENKFSTPLPEQQNKFLDGTLCKIYTLGYNRNAKDLKSYFYSTNSAYQLTALQVAASMQDSSLFGDISQCLYDTNDKVRIAASFALAQLGTEKAAKAIQEALDFESTLDVKAVMLRDLGRCGNAQTLDYVINLDIPINQLLLIEGQASALVNFSVRKIHSVKATRMVINQMDADIPSEIKEIYSLYFNRLKASYLKEFLLPLKNAYKTASVKSKMNIINVFGSIVNETSLRFLKQEIEADNDYRIKVNALSALANFRYELISETLFNSIKKGALNESIRASEILLKKNNKKDVERYFELAQEVSNSRVSANLIRAAMQVSSDKDKFANVVIDLYESQQNNYSKSFYIKALSSAVLQYKFVSNEVFKERKGVLRSAAMETLINMRKFAQFDSLNRVQLAKGGDDLKTAFATIFKRAIQSKDAALVSMTADLFADTTLGLLNEYPNVFFLQQAIEDCELPRDIEAYLSLVRAMDAYNIKHSVIDYQSCFALLDWNFIRKIPKEQKMLIKTSKGDIAIQLMVEKAPATVAFFIKQSLKNYYKNTFVHRTVPNFVIQSGDFRGDGWGTAQNMIRSEFSDESYIEGTLGIASAGKDTESSQWFITLSSTPHLDGRYTVFAKVIKGIEIAHKLEVGDEILNIELL